MPFGFPGEGLTRVHNDDASKSLRDAAQRASPGVIPPITMLSVPGSEVLAFRWISRVAGQHRFDKFRKLYPKSQLSATVSNGSDMH